MKVWYASAYGFPCAGDGGVYDRTGMVSSLVESGANVTMVTKSRRSSLAWREQHGVTVVAESFPADADVFIIEGFSLAWMLRENIGRVYSLLARHCGLVVYVQQDTEYRFVLDHDKLSKFLGQPTPLFVEQKRFALVTPGRDVEAVRETLLPPEIDGAAVLSFDLAACVPEGLFLGVDHSPVRRVSFFGRYSSNRRVVLESLARDSSMTFGVFGSWKNRFASRNVIFHEPVLQHEVPSIMNRFMANVSIYRSKQIALQWQPPRDFEAMQFGTPSLVPEGSPISRRPGFNPDWQFSGPVEFAELVRQLTVGSVRLEVVKSQQEWVREQRRLATPFHSLVRGLL